jgi:hypothetical protein
MDQGFSREMVIDHRRRTANRPGPEMSKHELGLVGQIEGDEFAWLHALGEEEGGISTGLGVCFLPGVDASAGPDCLFGGGETADLGLEPVPETGAVFST